MDTWQQAIAQIKSLNQLEVQAVLNYIQSVRAGQYVSPNMSSSPAQSSWAASGGSSPRSSMSASPMKKVVSPRASSRSPSPTRASWNSAQSQSASPMKKVVSPRARSASGSASPLQSSWTSPMSSPQSSMAASPMQKVVSPRASARSASGSVSPTQSSWSSPSSSRPSYMGSAPVSGQTYSPSEYMMGTPQASSRASASPDPWSTVKTLAGSISPRFSSSGGN